MPDLRAMPSSGLNRIHPSGERMMFDNLLFFYMVSMFTARSTEEFRIIRDAFDEPQTVQGEIDKVMD
jgi:hypothetical protein